MAFCVCGQNSRGFDLTYTDGAGFTTEFSKVADMPAVGSGPTYPGLNARSGILQIDNELWFTTVEGGNYPGMGSISAYDMISGQFSVKYSFGLPNPSDPTSARKDGYMSYATPVLGQGMYSGQIIYATRYGGANWFNTGATNSNNGGAVGVFNPATGTSTVLWSGDNDQTNTQLPSQVHSSPVYVNNTSGQYLYFLTNQGGNLAATGTTTRGSIVKLDLSTNTPTVVSTFSGSHFSGRPQTMPGQLPQGGGPVLVDDKIYFGSTGTSTLNVLNTVTDQVTTWAGPAGKTAGLFTTPIVDASRDAIYAVSLNQGIYKWDINTGMATTLANSTWTGTVQGSGILFQDSIFFVTQGTSENGVSNLYRYDLIQEQIYLEYNLGAIALSGFTSNQSGTFSVVNENGVDVLYFLTYAGGANNTGTLLRLEVTAVPEPSSLVLLASAGLGFSVIRRRVRS